MGVEQDIRQILQGVVDAENGNKSKTAEKLGIGVVTLWGWLKQDKVGGKSKEALWTALDSLGARVVLPETEPDPVREVCWVDAKVVPAGEGQVAPQKEDYLAVPLVEEVGAGSGIVPQGVLLGWFLVCKNQHAIMHKRDLIAVQIAEHSTSMMPTLRPKDIVLVDRQDLDYNRPGRIMLAIDPEGSGMIKRVSAVQTKDKDWQITFYSDNTAQNPPVVYSLREDYDGNWHKAIGGHVVWAWSDMDGR